jgi:hypothetical protein
VTLQQVDGVHVRVTCSACRATAELCCHRDPFVAARRIAVERFRRAGWHLDPGERARHRSQEGAERDGVGRWFCPACARRTHL